MDRKEIEKRLNKVANLIEQTPYEYYYIELRTKQDRYTMQRTKENSIIGFRGGVQDE